MLDFAESEKTGQLRRQLRGLIAESIPEDYLGAFTDDPNDHQIAKDFCRLLGENRLFALTWPVEWGGNAAGPWEQTALREEMWAFHEPRGPAIHGARLDRSGDHAIRNARSAGAISSAHRPGRGGLVPGFQRT